jgi:CRISPR-associated protein Cmr5
MTAPATGKPTLDQRRAGHAWEAVQKALKLEKEKDRKDYGREAKKLPMRIHAAGLGHALAFLYAKGKVKLPDSSAAEGTAEKAREEKSEDKEKAGFRQLIVDVTGWVILGRGLPAGVPGCLMQSITKGDALFLRRATEETLSYLLWLVRFAEAEGLTKDAEADDDE